MLPRSRAAPGVLRDGAHPFRQGPAALSGPPGIGAGQPPAWSCSQAATRTGHGGALSPHAAHSPAWQDNPRMPEDADAPAALSGRHGGRCPASPMPPIASPTGPLLWSQARMRTNPGFPGPAGARRSLPTLHARRLAAALPPPALPARYRLSQRRLLPPAPERWPGLPVAEVGLG